MVLQIYYSTKKTPRRNCSPLKNEISCLLFVLVICKGIFCLESLWFQPFLQRLPKKFSEFADRQKLKIQSCKYENLLFGAPYMWKSILKISPFSSFVLQTKKENRKCEKVGGHFLRKIQTSRVNNYKTMNNGNKTFSRYISNFYTIIISSFLICMTAPLTLLWRGPLSYRNQSIDLICSANQWTGFYIITVSVMKGLNYRYSKVGHVIGASFLRKEYTRWRFFQWF